MTAITLRIVPDSFFHDHSMTTIQVMEKRLHGIRNFSMTEQVGVGLFHDRLPGCRSVGG